MAWDSVWAGKRQLVLRGENNSQEKKLCEEAPQKSLDLGSGTEGGQGPKVSNQFWVGIQTGQAALLQGNGLC